MIFTRLALIVAVLALVVGGMNLLMGILVIQGVEGFGPAPRYGARTPGALIDRGIYAILFGIVVGTIAEFARRRK